MSRLMRIFSLRDVSTNSSGLTCTHAQHNGMPAQAQEVQGAWPCRGTPLCLGGIPL